VQAETKSSPPELTELTNARRMEGVDVIAYFCETKLHREFIGNSSRIHRRLFTFGRFAARGSLRTG
jgi:hypothetical protein